MTASASAPAPLPPAHPEEIALDACAALRADVAAQTADAAASGSPPQVPPPGADPVESWLLLVLTVERAAQLPPRARAAHFRAARSVWDDAADACEAPRYAAVGARLSRWRAADPTLPLVRDLLWVFEQAEGAGFTRLALAGYAALGHLVPADDVRRGYVLAQSARAARTLGHLEAARERYEYSEWLGARHRDRWLRARSRLGLGGAYRQIGNYAAMRESLHGVLRAGVPDPRLIAAAHHGLVLGAIAASDWDVAIAHGWHLLRAARRGAIPRADALLLMASVCRRIGRYRAARSAALAALRHCVLPEDPLVAHRLLVEVALDSGDRAAAITHVDALKRLVGGAAGPYEDAKALRAIGLSEERWGRRDRALAAVTDALTLARAHRFHELVFEMEPLIERIRARRAGHVRSGTAAAGGAARPNPANDVQVSPMSRRILARVLAVDTAAVPPVGAP